MFGWLVNNLTCITVGFASCLVGLAKPDQVTSVSNGWPYHLEQQFVQHVHGLSAQHVHGLVQQQFVQHFEQQFKQQFFLQQFRSRSTAKLSTDRQYNSNTLHTQTAQHKSIRFISQVHLTKVSGSFPGQQREDDGSEEGQHHVYEGMFDICFWEVFLAKGFQEREGEKRCQIMKELESGT